MQWIAAAVVSHHRDPDIIRDLYPSLEDGEPDPLHAYLAAIRTDTLLGLRRWLVDCAPKWIIALGLEQSGVRPLNFLPENEAIEHIHIRGAQQIRSLLRSYRRFLKGLDDEEQEVIVAGLTLRGHIINADHGGSAHVASLPILRFTRDDIYQSHTITSDRLYQHQREAHEAAGSSLLTAPTGSGKTEAALLWAAHQLQSYDTAPRLFYTLPYQASMNAMKLRLGKIFGDENVALQHGRGLLALYRLLMERDYSQVDAARTARLMKNLAQLNHTPVRVFSPYQMLKAMYRLKGYEAQLSDYHNALFIFDEIHAYEVKRLALILKTMEYLRCYFHARFFVMSATFPNLIKRWLDDALGSPHMIEANDALYKEFQRHLLLLHEGDLLAAENLKQIEEEARTGKSVLVVCNTVARAQKAFDLLRAALKTAHISVKLLHGRFNLIDRSAKEKFIREAAATGKAVKTPVVLVATQVVEVSLDIDLNTIYTDPAPLEALLQRFGRINRGRKIKPYAPVHVFTQPDDGQKIYNPLLIAKTLASLRRENGKPIDEAQVGTWLNEIYEGELAQQWEREFAAAAREFDDICIRTMRPFATAGDDLEIQFNKMFDGVEVLPESLYEEYERLRLDEPIAANTLLVPISWGRYHALANQGLLKPGGQTIPPIVLSEYSSELGLTFEKNNSADDFD